MQLKDAFDAATENVDVRPGFIGDVLTGGQRRRTRNRIRMAGVFAVITGLVGFGLGTEWGSGGGSTTASGTAEHVHWNYNTRFPLPRDATTWVIGTPAPAPGDDVVLRAANVARLDRWRLSASLADGGSVLVTSFTDDTGPRMVGALYRSSDRVDEVLVGPVVHPYAPGVLRLPGRGWVVVGQGWRLSYQTRPDEPWSPARNDVDLLPANAVRLQYFDERGYTAVDLGG